MFSIGRDGCKVTISVMPAYPIHGWTFHFSYTAEQEWGAVMLTENLRDKQGTELRRIREEAYQRGWKDAKAHRTKEKWFQSVWK